MEIDREEKSLTLSICYGRAGAEKRPAAHPLRLQQHGKVRTITDQSGNTETFRYDKEGRESEHTDRNGTVTQTKYNVYGRPVMKACTDQKGNRQIMGTWEYDSFGRLKKAVSGG